MKYLKFVLPLIILALVFSCKETKEKENVVTEEVAKVDPMADLPDWQYVGV